MYGSLWLVEASTVGGNMVARCALVDVTDGTFRLAKSDSIITTATRLAINDHQRRPVTDVFVYLRISRRSYGNITQ